MRGVRNHYDTQGGGADMSGVGLTEADYDKLRTLYEHGPNAFDDPEPPGDESLLTCPYCGYEWNYTGDNHRADCPDCRGKFPMTDIQDRRGITREMCNAIRCAAADGKSSREIATLFGFIDDPTAANNHATGRCSHDGGIRPVDMAAGTPTKVDAAACHRLRERWGRGDFETYTEAGEWLGVFRTTAAKHIREECHHA